MGGKMFIPHKNHKKYNNFGRGMILIPISIHSKYIDKCRNFSNTLNGFVLIQLKKGKTQAVQRETSVRI